MLRPETYLIVAAHPDDETIGAAAWMSQKRNNNLTLLHITDGSPYDLVDASTAGFSSRDSYAAARRQELYGALDILGLKDVQYVQFPFVDKDVYLHLPELIHRMVDLVEQIRPGIVLSPAYEGGHPDHDSAALAVALAGIDCRHKFRHTEYRLYHAGLDSCNMGTRKLRR